MYKKFTRQCNVKQKKTLLSKRIFLSFRKASLDAGTCVAGHYFDETRARVMTWGSTYNEGGAETSAGRLLLRAVGLSDEGTRDVAVTADNNVIKTL